MIMQWIPVAAGELDTLVDGDLAALAAWVEANTERAIDADKAWQGIHTVLTGTAFPEGHDLDALVFGGTPIGDEEFAMGPARYLRPDEVAHLAGLVEPIEVTDFEARIELGRLVALDVYPAVWDREDEAAINVEYLRDGYTLVRDGFLAARKDGAGMIVYLG